MPPNGPPRPGEPRRRVPTRLLAPAVLCVVLVAAGCATSSSGPSGSASPRTGRPVCTTSTPRLTPVHDSTVGTLPPSHDNDVGRMRQPDTTPDADVDAGQVSTVGDCVKR